MPVLALVAEGTAQKDRRGAYLDSNMWRVASQVADDFVYVSGIGVNQSFAPIRMATGWGGAAKSRQLLEGAREKLASADKLGNPLTVLGFGGSRGCAVLLRAISYLGISVHGVVLFDSVYSFGFPWIKWLDNKLWPNAIPGNIQHALHLIAEHEDTPGFAPTIYPSSKGLLQVRTPGDHREVLRGREAERIALAWLSTLGIPARFRHKSEGWGEPLRRLEGLGYYWSEHSPLVVPRHE